VQEFSRTLTGENDQDKVLVLLPDRTVKKVFQDLYENFSVILAENNLIRKTPQLLISVDVKSEKNRDIQGKETLKW